MRCLPGSSAPKRCLDDNGQCLAVARVMHHLIETERRGKAARLCCLHLKVRNL